jgi:HEAT repeat protein
MNKTILRVTAAVLGIVVGVVLAVFFFGSQEESPSVPSRSASKPVEERPAAVSPSSDNTKTAERATDTEAAETSSVETPEAASAEEPESSDDVRAELERFKDTSRPVNQRRRDISILAKRGDDRSIEILMALGNEKTYLNWAAVEALGQCLKPEVTEYLKGKLEAKEKRVMCAAIRSYARHMGEAAVPELADLLKKNRTRPDGWEVQVQSEIVKVMAGLNDPKTVPVLAEELGRFKESNWDLNYGSVVVAALGRVGTPDAHSAIKTYADGLTGMKPEDPLAKKHFEDKIAEAQSAIKGDINEDLFKREL